MEIYQRQQTTLQVQVTLNYPYIHCIHISCLGFPALLITGGKSGVARTQAYVISPTIGYEVNCTIPKLGPGERGRWHHTINNWTICGGGVYIQIHEPKSCVTLTSGMWKKTHNLSIPRSSKNTAVGQSRIRLSYLGEETHLIMDQLKL